MEENGGVYLPPDIVKGRHVFFAIDNVGLQRTQMMGSVYSMGLLWQFTRGRIRETLVPSASCLDVNVKHAIQS